MGDIREVYVVTGVNPFVVLGVFSTIRRAWLAADCWWKAEEGPFQVTAFTVDPLRSLDRGVGLAEWDRGCASDENADG